MKYTSSQISTLYKQLYLEKKALCDFTHIDNNAMSWRFIQMRTNPVTLRDDESERIIIQRGLRLMRNSARYTDAVVSPTDEVIEIPEHLRPEAIRALIRASVRHPDMLSATIQDSSTRKFYATDYDGTITDEDAYDDSVDFFRVATNRKPNYRRVSGFISRYGIRPYVWIKPHGYTSALEICKKSIHYRGASLAPMFAKRQGYNTAIISAGGASKIIGGFLYQKSSAPIVDLFDFIAAPNFVPTSVPPKRILCDITEDKQRLYDIRKMWLMAGERFVNTHSGSVQDIGLGKIIRNGKLPNKTNLLMNLLRSHGDLRHAFVIYVGDSDSDISVADTLIRLVERNTIKGAIIFAHDHREKSLLPYLQLRMKDDVLAKAVACLPYRDMLHLRLLLEAIHTTALNS